MGTMMDQTDTSADGTSDLLLTLAQAAGELVLTLLGGGELGIAGTIISALVQIALPLISDVLPIIEQMGVSGLLDLFGL